MERSSKDPGFFNRRNRERPEIAEVRRALLSRLLYVFSLLGVPAAAIGAAQAYAQGRRAFSAAYVGIYLLFLVATFASRRLPYRLRALALVSCIYLVALTILIRIGMSGVGLPLMIAAGFLTTVLFGFRAGVLAIVVILASVSFVAAGMTMGFIETYPEHMLTSRSAASWVTGMIVFFLTVSTTVIAPEMYRRRVEESLDLVEKHRGTLEAANESLRQEVKGREAAEATLRESERRFQVFMEHLPAAAFMKDAEGRVLYANRFLCELFGWKDTEGKSTYDLLPPEMADKMVADDRAVLAGSPAAVAERIVDKDGGERFFETRKFPIRIEGRPPLLGGISVDVTGLRQAEEHFRQVVELSPYGIFLECGGHFTYLNPAALQLFGAEDPQQLIGSSVFERMHPETRKRIRERVRALYKVGPQLPALEEKYLRLDGTIVDAEVIAAPFGLGKEPTLLAIICDITERKRTEEALRESEERFRALIKNSSDIVSVLTADGIATYQSPAIKRILGYEPEELTGVNTFEYIHTDDLQGARLAFSTGIKEGGITSPFPYRYRHADGSWVHMEAIGSNHLDDPAIRGVVVNSRDITERKRAEEALRESAEQYRIITNTALNGFLVSDRDSRLLDVNEAYCQMLGYSRDELLKMSIRDVEAMEKPDEVDRHIQKIIETGSDRFETQLRRKDGRIIDVEVSMTFMHRTGRQLTFVRDITERKRAEEALRNSEERLRVALEGTADGIWDWNPRTGRAYFSPRYYTMLGYEPDEFPPAYESWRQLLHPDDAEAAEKALQHAVEEHSPFAVEFRCKTKNGEWRWILGRGKVAELDGDGHAVRVAGSHSDITERKRAEEALERRVMALTQPLDTAEEIAFEDLFNISEIQRLQDLSAKAWGVAALITYPDGRPITQPSNFCDLCIELIRKTPKGIKNCSHSDAVIGRHNTSGPNVQRCLSAGLCNAGASITVGGRHVANWLIGQVRNEAQDEEEMMEYAREIGADETAFRAAYRRVPIMSQEQFERVAHVLFAMANQISLFAYQNVQQARFITERKRVEEALRESEERFSKAFNTSPGPMVISEIESGRFIDVNEQTLRTLGFTREEMIDHTSYELGIWGDPEDRTRLVTQLRREGSFREFPVRFITKARNARDVLWSGEIITLGNKRVLLSLFFDITERKRAEEELAKYREHLEELVQERTRELEAAQEELVKKERLTVLGQLTAMVSHELRNPLSVIRSSAYYLERKFGKESEKAAKHLNRIEKQVEVCDSIVSDLLEYTRGSHIQMEEGDLNALVRQVLEQKLESLDVGVRSELSPALCPVAFDAEKMRRVLLNVLDNGIEATSLRVQRGTEAEKVYRPHLVVRTREEQGGVFIEVEDNGVGMDQSTLGKAMEPLFTTKARGTGLGLAIVRKVVEEHGGSVALKSGVNQGTKVTIRIPSRRVA